MRYFCQITTSSRLEHDYARALRDLGHGLRILPIGAVVLPFPSVPLWEGWKSLEEHLSAPLAQEAINIVCSRLSLSLGSEMTEGDLGPNTKVNGLKGLSTDPQDLVYSPSGTFVGLLTPGMVNIAVTHMGRADAAIGSEEAASLRNYDAVIVASELGRARLWDLDIHAIHLHPTQTAGLASLIESFRTWEDEKV